MQEIVSQIVKTVNFYLWDKMILLVLLFGTGIYFTISLGFIQIRKFKMGIKLLFGGFSLNGDKNKKGLTSFQALSTAIAAQVGTGNLAGAAVAIYEGGPGAIFWMWVSAFFGMATIYAEAVLAQKTRISKAGEYLGGPVYYINYILKGKFAKFLAGFFAIAIILALGFMGNMVQSNSIADSFVKAFGGNKLVVGLGVGFLVGLIVLGGIKRIAWVTEKVVPIMALVYVLGCLIIIFKFYDQILITFESIFISAFSSKSMIGGAMGVGIKRAMRYGVAKGLFSNEAGMGSTPHAHATANVKNPSEQGMIAMLGVFIDTFIILTMTALVILVTGSLKSGENGAALTQTAFNYGFGNVGHTFIALCMFFFAFTTIMGWYYFGEVNVRYLFGNNYVKPYALLVVICVIIGSTLKVQLVWDMADMFNGFMVLPNLIALLFAGKLVKQIMVADEKTQ